MNDEQKLILQHAIWLYGQKAQLLMAIEEMSELTKEICKDFRGQLDISHMAEEVADVEIMLKQVKMIYASSNGDFEQQIADFTDYKLKRLAEKMDKDRERWSK